MNLMIKIFQSGINYKHNPFPPWYWFFKHQIQSNFLFFPKQILVPGADFSGHCSKGAALLCRNPRPGSRSSRNGLVPDSPGTCSVWWARGQVPLRWLPGHRAFWNAKVLMLIRKSCRTGQVFFYQRSCFISPFPNLQKFLQTAYIRLNMDSYQCQLQIGWTWIRQLLQVQSGRPWAFRWVVCCWLVGGRIALSSWILEITTQVKLLFLSSYHMYLALLFLIYTMYT